MNRVRPALLCLLVLAPAVAAPVPKVEKKSEDARLLEGKWVSVTITWGDKPQRYTDFNLTFKDAEVTEDYGGGPRTGVFTLNETSTPKQLDADFPKARKPLGQIYRLDGDTLTICRARADKNPRPTEFKGSDNAACIVFKRVKE